MSHPIAIDREQVVAALVMNDGFIKRTARELNLNATTLRRFIDRDPELVQMARNLREQADYVGMGNPAWSSAK